MSSSSETALKRCDEHITWYAASGRCMRWSHYGSQVAVIILTASVPLLALLASEPAIKDSASRTAVLLKSSVLQACLAGLAAVIVSLANLFQWHKKWLARAFTCETLKSERIKFQTRAGEPYASAKDEEDAARHFVLRVEQIAAEELHEWKSIQASTGRE